MAVRYTMEEGKEKGVTVKVTPFCWSGYQDSNLGPPAPKAGALTGLRYTPIQSFLNCGAKIGCFFELSKIKVINCAMAFNF